MKTKLLSISLLCTFLINLTLLADYTDKEKESFDNWEINKVNLEKLSKIYQEMNAQLKMIMAQEEPMQPAIDAIASEYTLAQDSQKKNELQTKLDLTKAQLSQLESQRKDCAEKVQFLQKELRRFQEKLRIYGNWSEILMPF